MLELRLKCYVPKTNVQFPRIHSILCRIFNQLVRPECSTLSRHKPL